MMPTELVRQLPDRLRAIRVAQGKSRGAFYGNHTYGWTIEARRGNFTLGYLHAVMARNGITFTALGAEHLHPDIDDFGLEFLQLTKLMTPDKQARAWDILLAASHQAAGRAP